LHEPDALSRICQSSRNTSIIIAAVPPNVLPAEFPSKIIWSLCSHKYVTGVQ
jgi:hypothetical protein